MRKRGFWGILGQDIKTGYKRAQETLGQVVKNQSSRILQQHQSIKASKLQFVVNRSRLLSAEGRRNLFIIAEVRYMGFCSEQFPPEWLIIIKESFIPRNK